MISIRRILSSQNLLSSETDSVPFYRSPAASTISELFTVYESSYYKTASLSSIVSNVYIAHILVKASVATGILLVYYKHIYEFHSKG